MNDTTGNKESLKMDAMVGWPVITKEARVAHYRQAWTRGGYIVFDGGWVYGVWVIGNQHSGNADYHGAYPGDYLKRMRCLFWDKQSVLHMFSGKADLSIFPGATLDIRADLNPDYCVDVRKSVGVVPYHTFDLILADPPYTEEDAGHYGTSLVPRQTVLKTITQHVLPGTHLAWLDQMKPTYSNKEWELEAIIGLDLSTNRRIRGVWIFRRL
jgi:hypothetical protein